jgi:phosphohistidine swiveling domain-containing protein
VRAVTAYILDLSNRRALDPALTGGKGSSLAWLRAQRFNVPPGFVITTAAFAAAPAVLPPGGPAGAPAPIPVPADVERLVRRAYRRLGGRVAVRSSMVGEDSEAASYAGQLETVLDVEGEDAVLRALETCWASAFSARVAAYARTQDAAQDRSGSPAGDHRPQLAVVVQRMVQARAAGVAFSADPGTGQRCVIVEAVPGLGESLVQGMAEPDRYLVDARGELAEACPVDSAAPVLAPDQLLELARQVRLVARARGVPQDIEWAWDDAGVHLLQARPITSLTGLHIYSNRMVSDMAPGLIKPLVYSIATVGKVRGVFGTVFGELIGPSDFDYARLVPLIRSRAYADMTLLGELLERAGLPANLLEMMGRDEMADFRHPRMDARAVWALLRAVRLGWKRSRPRAEIERFLPRHEAVLAPYRESDWASTPPQGLLAALDPLIDAHGRVLWYNFIIQVNMMVRNHGLARLLGRRAPDVPPSELTRGLVGLKALEPNADLRRLAAEARALGPETLEQIAYAGSPDARDELLAGSAAGRSLKRSVEAFMARYGHLSPVGTDFSEASWAENPELIWQAVVRAAGRPADADPADSASPRPGTSAGRDDARGRARARFGPLGRPIFDRVLTSTVSCIHQREQLSDMMSQDTYQIRRIMLALARQLVAQGRLSEPDDLFYLTHDEVRDLVGGELTGGEARRRAAERRAAIQADAEVELPATICGDRIPAHPIELPAGQEYLSGIRGSSGRAQGYARVVLSPAHAPADLGREHILVVPFTDVGWTPLFPGVGGIVAETGGQLSHTSIVAREYGLPAVVSVRQATHLIQEGQPITVDGDAGRVYLKHVLSA